MKLTELAVERQREIFGNVSMIWGEAPTYGQLMDKVRSLNEQVRLLHIEKL